MLTHRPHAAGEDKHSSFPSPKRDAQHCSSESVVVVLGVLYPSFLPSFVETGTHLDRALLPVGSDAYRQGGNAIFYDPLSDRRIVDEAVLSVEYRKKDTIVGYLDHAKARRAVSRDLALLCLRKHR